jgi:hypothetical protein
MHALQEIERLVTTLSRAEKAPVFQWVVRDPGERLPGLRVPRVSVGGSRVSFTYAFLYGAWSKPNALARVKLNSCGDIQDSGQPIWRRRRRMPARTVRKSINIRANETA